MGKKTSIEYCDSSNNPLVGCNGCELLRRETCYAKTLVTRYAGLKGWPQKFTDPEFFFDRFDKMLKWKDLTGKERPDKPWLNGMPRIIFFVDLGDAFSPGLDFLWPEPYIEAMAESPHIYLWLTKWPHTMKRFFDTIVGYVPANFWLGTSITSRTTIFRGRRLQEIDHDKLWISMEPLLARMPAEEIRPVFEDQRLLWCALGGESGRHATYLHPDWVTEWSDICLDTDTKRFFKQWGAWLPIPYTERQSGDREIGNGWVARLTGKHEAGRRLNDVVWTEMPTV